MARTRRIELPTSPLCSGPAPPGAELPPSSEPPPTPSAGPPSRTLPSDPASRISRRAFLGMCAAAGAGAALALGGCAPSEDPIITTTTAAGAGPDALSSSTSAAVATTTTSSVAAAPAYASPPSGLTRETLLAPNSAGVLEFEGTPLAGGSGEAVKNTRYLKAEARATCQPPVQASGGLQRVYLRWNYTHPQNAGQVRGAVQVSFDASSWHVDTDLAPDAVNGGATAFALLTAEVTNTASGEQASILVKRQCSASLGLYDLNDQVTDFDQGSLVFQPGAAYTIDVVLWARVDVENLSEVYGGIVVGADSGYGSGIGTISASVSGVSIALVSLEPPWVQSHITTIFNPTVDTYDLYEQDLKEVTGKEYFASGALLRVAAGGAYDGNQSGISINTPSARIVRVSTSLPCVISDDRAHATLSFPPAASLPLGGRIWNIGVTLDPQFNTPMGGVDPYLPVFGAPLLMMGEVEEATRSVNNLGKLASSGGLKSAKRSLTGGADEGGAPLASLAASAQPAMASQEVFTFRNFFSALPISQFDELTLASDSRLAVAMNSHTLPAKLVLPTGGTTPKLNTKGLSITVASPHEFPSFNGLSTEPVVVISLLDLWAELWACWVSVRHPLATWQGVEYPAIWNPRFITLLQRVGNAAEQHRVWLDSLYFLPPGSNEAIKLTDLPEYVEDWAKSDHDLYVRLSRLIVPLVLIFSPRLRRWVRRVLTAELMEAMWEELRPKQLNDFSVKGWVAQAGGTNYKESTAALGYTVIFEFVPELQPLPVAAPANLAV